MVKPQTALAALALALITAPSLGTRAVAQADPPKEDPGLEEFIQSLPLPDPMTDNFFLHLIKDPESPKFELKRPNLPKGRKWVPSHTFEDTVTDESVEKLVGWIKAADKAGADAVLIEIDSPGGSVDAGNKLIRAIEDAGMKVYCVVDGDAASMAFAILQSCDERSATDRASLMAHEPSLSGFFRLQPQDSRNLQQRLDVVTKSLIKQYAKKLKGGVARVHEKIDGGKEWWMDATEALDEGAVDCVAPSREQVLRAYESGKSCGEAAKMPLKKKRG